MAKPLSNDQTPYRKDERERVKKAGARVLSMDQIEGLEPVHENWGDLLLGALQKNRESTKECMDRVF